MLESAIKWLHKSWWGVAVAYPIVLFGVYGLIWYFAEPIGIPDNISKLPDFAHYRIFFHLLIALIITPHVVLFLTLLVRRSEKKDLSDFSLRVSSADKALFAQLLAEFPPDGTSVKFLHEQDVGASFESSQLDQIHSFLYYWHDASHEFQNTDAERLRAQLYETLADFSQKLGQNVTERHREGWLTMGIKDFDTRLDLLKERDELNKMATVAYELYQDLIRLGRKFE